MSRFPTSPGVRAVDRALADALRRLDPETDPRVLRAAELASFAVSLGHAALDLSAPPVEADAPCSPDEWRRALEASRWVARPAGDAPAPEDAPLVLEDDLLYLRRYREYERRLAAGLRRLAMTDRSVSEGSEDSSAGVDACGPPAPWPDVPSEAMRAAFVALFGDPQDSHDAQARAALLALRRRLLLVTGGPGTGKTTTIARLLLLLVAQAGQADAPAPRIALAAPTGRAAERMAESLRAIVSALPTHPALKPEWCDALPREARTLHRLLGSLPGSTRFRHDASNPLPYDIVVVDEASMVDLPLMCKLVEAVPDGARLILLGDADQLPSVEAGDVLAAIVEAAGVEAAGVDPAERLGEDVGAEPGRPAADGPLQGHRVQLRRGFRQSEALQLAPLADAARAGDADTAIALLHEGRLGGVQYHADAFDLLTGALRERLLGPWRELQACTDPAAALALAQRVRVLAALRDGPQGAVQLNARIEEALAGAQRDPYFHGRLLLVSENSYRHGLFNGDIGLCLRDDTGALVAWFPGGIGVRGFHPGALPAHGPAFATTVHKAQGSEYDSVWLQLPRQEARPLSRELVYTALTRARRELHVCASDEMLRFALSRRAARVSGLAQRLR